MVKKIEKKVENLVIEELDKGYELVDVEFVQENNENYLRVFVDRVSGNLTIEDCEKISRRLSKLLDDLDIIDRSYFLEVSSPGTDRVLKKDKDFIREKGKLVYIKFYKKINGEKNMVAKLLGLGENDNILLEKDGKEMEVDRNDVAIIRLHVEI